MYNELIIAMLEYYRGDAKRIQHFTKVHSYAKLLGELAELDAKEQHILETAAIVHDIGIKLSEAKYGSSAGKYQEQEGPAEARRLLTQLNFAPEVIERVCYLVAHHHTYDNIQELDYQLLVEADFLVNFYEDALSAAAIRGCVAKIFRSAGGKKLAGLMYDI